MYVYVCMYVLNSLYYFIGYFLLINNDMYRYCMCISGISATIHPHYNGYITSHDRIKKIILPITRVHSASNSFSEQLSPHMYVHSCSQVVCMYIHGISPRATETPTPLVNHYHSFPPVNTITMT